MTKIYTICRHVICSNLSHKPQGLLPTLPKLPFPRTLIKAKLLRLTRASLFMSSLVFAGWRCMMPASPAAAIKPWSQVQYQHDMSLLWLLHHQPKIMNCLENHRKIVSEDIQCQCKGTDTLYTVLDNGTEDDWLDASFYQQMLVKISNTHWSDLIKKFMEKTNPETMLP